MANPEHLDILKYGVEVWNQWREDHPEIQPNLEGIFLRVHTFDKINLRKTNFRHADLGHLKFIDSSLSGADFTFAFIPENEFIRTDLRGAHFLMSHVAYCFFNKSDFSGAKIDKSVFEDATFHEAVFNRTSLSQTLFDNCDFKDADMNEASMRGCAFQGVDLSAIKNLENIKHNGSSNIGFDTLIRSHGNIPEIFLRGAGVPQPIIEQIPSLIGSLSPIDYYSCFISYSSKDQAFAERLYADLQAKGVRCWFAPHHMRIGEKIRPRVDESIRLYDKLLLVLSEHSVASQWVEHEVETALGKELEGKPNVLFPIRLDDRVMESKTGWASHIRLTRHIGDFTNWKSHDEYQKAFDRLLRDLKAGT